MLIKNPTSNIKIKLRGMYGQLVSSLKLIKLKIMLVKLIITLALYLCVANV